MEQSENDRPALEIEVTPAMISAGLHALWPVEPPPFEIDEDVVARVYVAMENARFSR